MSSETKIPESEIAEIQKQTIEGYEKILTQKYKIAGGRTAEYPDPSERGKACMDAVEGLVHSINTSVSETVKRSGIAILGKYAAEGPLHDGTINIRKREELLAQRQATDEIISIGTESPSIGIKLQCLDFLSERLLNTARMAIDDLQEVVDNDSEVLNAVKEIAVSGINLCEEGEAPTKLGKQVVKKAIEILGDFGRRVYHKDFSRHHSEIAKRYAVKLEEQKRARNFVHELSNLVAMSGVKQFTDIETNGGKKG